MSGGAATHTAAVIGAGIAGLSTAVRIQELQGSSVQVTLIADRCSPNTTSDCAAGIWYPHLLNDTPEEDIRRWGRATLDHMQQLYSSPHAAEMGVSMISGHIVYHQPHQEKWKDLFPAYTRLSDDVTRRLYPNYTEAYSCTSFMIESYLHLPYLMKRFEKNGGNYIQKKIKHLSELSGQYDVIVNTTGIGSRDLLKDEQLQPVRGQALRMKAPWVKHFIIAPEDTSYIIPGIETVVVGGTHHFDDFNLSVRKEDTQEFMGKAYSNLPSLKSGVVTKQVAGLRPSRTRVRVELEMMRVGSKETIPVVHNYGHGGSGVTLSWGCAVEAAHLAVTYLAKAKPIASKM